MQVTLIRSFTDAERSALLVAAAAVVYTPANEHFGIVPLEAMAAGRPVLACNSGGPTESVQHGRTGLLAAPEAAAFACAMAQLAVRLPALSLASLSIFMPLPDAELIVRLLPGTIEALQCTPLSSLLAESYQ